MIVLGIDPGCTTAGVLVEDSGRGPVVLDSWWLIEESWAKGCGPYYRGAKLGEKVFSLLSANVQTIDVIACEIPVERKNRRTLGLQWAMATGAVIGAFRARPASIHEVEPSVAKRCLTGNARASKEAVLMMAERTLPGFKLTRGYLDSKPADRFHLADAAAVALAGHAWIKKVERERGSRG